MNIKKEIPILTIVAIPFLYLLYIWKDLPKSIPVHWNSNLEIDRYGNKWELLLICIFLPLLTYIIFLVVPKIDPKNKIPKMGNKYYNIKFLVTTIMSILSIIIIYSAKNQSINNPNYMLLAIGALYVILGNYFQTIKPNYFIGIKTPWTLESETVWKKTHQLGGKLWFVGGAIILICSLLLEPKLNSKLFLFITLIICIIPIVYSYTLFKKENIKTKNSL